jgi:HprK-related kinase B
MKEADFFPLYPNLPYRLGLRIAGRNVLLSIDNASLLEEMHQYFLPFVTSDITTGDESTINVYGINAQPYFNSAASVDIPRGNGRPSKAEAYEQNGVRIIRKKRNGVVQYIHRDMFCVVGDLVSYSDELIKAVCLALGRSFWREGYITVHGSAVAKNNVAIVFAGTSSGGKSTLALNLVDRGYDFVSNDRVMVGRSSGYPRALGVPKWPRVNPGTLLSIPRLRQTLVTPEKEARYLKMKPKELWDLEEKHDVRVDWIYGTDRLDLDCLLRTIYILCWKNNGEPMRQQVVSAEEGGRLLSPTIKYEAQYPALPPVPSASALAAQLRNIRIIKITGGFDIPGLASTVH